jgi:hypothetical protein
MLPGAGLIVLELVLPTKTTITATNLTSLLVDTIHPVGCHLTHAAVAANTSTLLAFVPKAKQNENSAVSPATMPRRASILCTKYSTMMAAMGKSEEMAVLTLLTNASSLLSAYRLSPASRSVGAGF